MRFHFSFALRLGKRIPAAQTDATTLDSDSWKCDSQLATDLREASTTDVVRGPFSFAG